MNTLQKIYDWMLYGYVRAEVEAFHYRMMVEDLKDKKGLRW